MKINKKRKKGFTLSEVLITLTLIGVITALVVPSLVASTGYKKKIVSFKKAYNTISGAYSQAAANAGGGFKDIKDLTDELVKYMNVKYYYSYEDTPKLETNHGVTSGSAGTGSNWIVTEDDIAYRIVQNVDSATTSDSPCKGHTKIAINTANALSTTKTEAACPCYTVTIDIDGLKKGESTTGKADPNAIVSLGTDKITNITGDRFKVYISESGVTVGNPNWEGSDGAAAKIMAYDE